MSDYHDYHENLAFPPQEIKSQHELSEQGRQSDVIISAIEKCEKLEKQLKIAVEAFTEIELYRYDVDDIDQEDWFKIATYMADLAQKTITKIKEIK